nr:PadR family transcriptional regulator [Planctomonas sp. JC2975]
MLTEEPLHGYAMRRRIEERAYDRLPGVKTSSLYDAIRRLDAAGLIDSGGTDRDGNRPDRTRFAITPQGAAALTAWLQETLSDDSDADGLPAALSFMYPLGREQTIELLGGRLERMSATLEADETALRNANAEATNPIFLSEHEYQLARRRAERAWLADLLTSLESGALVWPVR